MGYPCPECGKDMITSLIYKTDSSNPWREVAEQQFKCWTRSKHFTCANFGKIVTISNHGNVSVDENQESSKEIGILYHRRKIAMKRQRKMYSLPNNPDPKNVSYPRYWLGGQEAQDHCRIYPSSSSKKY